MPIYLKRVQLNPRARRNMAYRYGPFSVDTVEELQALLEAHPQYDTGAAAPAKKAKKAKRKVKEGKKVRRPRKESGVTSSSDPFASAMARIEKLEKGGGGGSSKAKYLFPELLEYKYNGLYRVLARYVGGQKAFCPALRALAKSKRKRLTNVEAFRAMGVEPDRASGLLDRFSAQHEDLDTLSDGQAAANLAFLMSQPGVACPTTKTNPRRRRR